ncbi:putative transposase [Rhodovulum sulfidophilum]|uniref:Putative transposase n=1 Tax=Rhodovulum sulfidophilum TaxID=35806 RepID=A0A0D6B123_RHOSU|nr:putative transposase [Rhodovulum sulfidophilum]
MQAVNHAITDATSDARHLRNLIERDLGAEPRTHANPSHTIKYPLNPCFHAAQHKVENALQRLKRLRRIARHCEKTKAAVMGFVHLAATLAWLR